MSGDSTRTLEFEMDARGAPLRYRVKTAKGDPIIFDRVNPWSPTAKSLASFAGTYASDEAAASWMLRVRADTLGVIVRPGVFEAMRPLYRDAFEVPSEGWLITFKRARDGAITGFDVGTTRMRTMPFAKRPAASH